MLFSSTTFILYFLPAVLIIYYGLLRNKRKIQNTFLLIVSLLFYAWGEPKFVLIMLLSVVANWFFGLSVYRNLNKNNIGLAKLSVAAAVVFNFSILFIFKYLTFTLNTISQVFNTEPFGINIALPIGISFFTFQAMSYVIDVYREKELVQKNILNVALYISFFPQLIAGPIVRYETVAEEINERKETVTDFFDGFARFIVGLAKKVLLANVFGIFADLSFNEISGISVVSSWMGALAYTFQIFFDFSGYSDMAIGLGKMFGFHFLENFNYPYISRSITEFWRRWHMSLGSWFRDYVYIPLGGSRVNNKRLILNLFVVWSFTGIWHGANWTFLVWGLMYFVLLCFEKNIKLDKKNSGIIGNLFRWIYTMLFVILGWVVFRANSLAEALNYIKAMFGLASNGLVDNRFIGLTVTFCIYLIFAILFSTPIAPYISERIKNKTFFQCLRAVSLIIIFLLSFASIVSSSHNPFIYFNF